MGVGMSGCWNEEVARKLERIFASLGKLGTGTVGHSF